MVISNCAVSLVASEAWAAAERATRWITTLSLKVDLPYAINFRALCEANLVTYRSKETLELYRVEGNILKGFTDFCLEGKRLFPEWWLKSKPESGLDCLICAEFTRQRQCISQARHPGQFHMQTLLIYKLGFNQNYYTSTLMSLIRIVMCSKFHWNKFINYKCFHMKFRAPFQGGFCPECVDV